MNGDGYEYEVVANLTVNWRLSFSASQNHQETANKYPLSRAYMEANRAAWMARGDLYTATTVALLTGGTEGRVTLNQLIEAADTTLATARAEEGMTRRMLREWNGSFFTSYKFAKSESWLRGLSMGGGGQYQGRSPIGYDGANNGALIYGNDFFLLNGMIAYCEREWISNRPPRPFHDFLQTPRRFGFTYGSSGDTFSHELAPL